VVGAIPQTGFLFSIAGLSLSLAGFSGLVAAFRRGAPLQPRDAFRLREIPEMALATMFLAVLIIPLADATGNPKASIQIVCGLAILFTLAHALGLVVRAGKVQIETSIVLQNVILLIDVLILFTGSVGLALGTTSALEWLLLFLLARPALAFVFVLSEVTSG